MTDNPNNYDPNNPYGQPASGAGDTGADAVQPNDASAAPSYGSTESSSAPSYGAGDSSAAPSYGSTDSSAAPSYGSGDSAVGTTGSAPAGQAYGQTPGHGGVATQEDPGKTLGIVSLVASLASLVGFAFIGPIVGIITGVMARKNSRAAGLPDNTLGKWGFILGIIFLILSVIGVILMIVAFSMAASQGYSTTY